MFKKIKSKSMAFLLAMTLLTGCSPTSLPTNSSIAASTSSNDNSILEFNAQENIVIGTVRHGPAAQPEYAEDGITPLPLEYSGGTLTIPYKASVEGLSVDIGFLVFWDGVPVAYDVGEGTGVSYLHTFSQTEGEELEFSIRFMPTGNAGETHTITFASIYNPYYKPDMKSSSGYGAYHNMLCCSRSVYLTVSPDDTTPNEASASIHDFTVAQEELTHHFIKDELSAFYGCEELTMEELDKTVRFAEFIDGTAVFDNYLLKEDPVTIDFCLFGTDGKEYAVTFFVDHKPAFETQLLTVEKGMVTRLSVSIDPSEIEQSATIYFIAVPLDSDGYAEKSSSILLYKQ